MSDAATTNYADIEWRILLLHAGRKLGKVTGLPAGMSPTGCLARSEPELQNIPPEPAATSTARRGDKDRGYWA